MTEDDLRLSFEHVDTALQKQRLVQIVVSAAMEERASGEFEDAIEVRRRSYVLFIAKVAYSRILRLVASANFARAIGRCVVGDDDLEILEALRPQGIQRFRKILFAVVNGNPD
jgi:hypothetical protein